MLKLGKNISLYVFLSFLSSLMTGEEESKISQNK